MKFLAVVFVALAMRQSLGLPTVDGNTAEIQFSEDNGVYPPVENGQKIEFLQDNEAKSLEEALFAYTEVVEGKKKIHTSTNEIANDQTNALCNDEPYCDCTTLKYASYQGTNSQGEQCTIFNVPHCEGVCAATFKYDPVEDRVGAEPTLNESYKCCLSAGTVYLPFFTLCKRSDGTYYSLSQTYKVPRGCECSSATPCTRR